MGCGNVSTFSSSKPFQGRSLRLAVANYESEVHDNGQAVPTGIPKGTYEVKLMDGTVSSPYPEAVTINRFEVPTYSGTFWEFIQTHTHKVVKTRGQHWDWLIEIAKPRVRIKYSDIDLKSRLIASGLYKLGLREKVPVIFHTNNPSLVTLLYFAVWRSGAIVHIVADSRDAVLAESNSQPCFLVCDRTTEMSTTEIMDKHSEKEFILISIGKLRHSPTIDISELLEDDGKDCPDNEAIESLPDEVILITSKGACHTNTSLIIAFMHVGLLRNSGPYQRQYFFPVSSEEDEGNSHTLTPLFWPISALLYGKTIILLDSPIIHSVTVAMREFAVASVCGCPSFLQKISRHIAEQGGTIPSVTSAVIHSNSKVNLSEKILRKGFPNLRTIDICYGFDEALFFSSTIPPPTLSAQEVDHDSFIPIVSGPLLHPHTTGTLGIFSIAKCIDIDTGVRLGPGEPGELCFKTGTSMKHYLSDMDRKDKKTIVDGWIHSGDFGYYDSSGCLYVTGRVHDVFKYYADYISPLELEFVLQTHPDVRDCVVLGIPDAMAGHLPCAVVVRRMGSNVSSKELRTFVNSRVPNAKQLRGGIIFMDELPGTSDLPNFRQHILHYLLRHN